MKNVVIASQNPVKVQAAQAGFQKLFPEDEFTFQGVSAPSGVREQPLSEAEAYLGVCNRIEAAQQAQPDADFWVGFEGGVEDKDSGMVSFSWVMVRGRSGQVGESRTASLLLPPEVAKLIHDGRPLSDAADIIFNQTKTGSTNGVIGALTGDIITRTDVYRDAVIYALVPFKNQQLYT